MKNKHSISNLAKAIHRLKEMGFVVNKHPTKEMYDVHRIGSKEYCPSPDWPNYFARYGDPFDRNPREVIKFSNIYSNLNNQNTAKKQFVKSTAKRARKSSDHNLLKTNNYDLDKIDELPQIEWKTDDATYFD